MIDAFTELLEGKRLPPMTEAFLYHPAWPAVFAVLYIAICILLILKRIPEGAALHSLVVGLLLESSCLCLAAISIVIPFVSTVSRLIQ